MSNDPTTSAIEYDATQELSVKDANKVAVGALIGTALEWYDFFLFSAAAALIFNVQYFTSENATAAALASFATFGVGLAARPIGGIIFGRMGDRIGRRRVLMITIVGIGIVTGLIGMLPTYAAIGFAAPVLLVLLRIAQGLFVGGEWSGAMTLVVENAPLHLRARYAAIPQIGSPIGTILSSGGFFVMTLLLSQENFNSWGWRIPFLVAIPLLLVAVYIRSRLEESPVFRQLEESGEVEKSPISTTLKRSWKQIIVGMAAALLGVGGFYLVTAFCVYYGVNILGYDDSLLLLGSMVAAAVEILILIWGGMLGAKYGASRVILWGGIASAVIAVPAFLLFESGQPVLIVIAMTIAVGALSLPYAASGTVLTGLFPATTRYTGVGMAQNAAGMLSGFIPLLATGFVASANDHWWPAAAMLVFLSLFTAFAGAIAPRLSVDLPGFKH
ncbi:MFS transporter [Brevibacterium casei]|uniref:Na+/melibiose symporter n=1 Tax=Brevibacterium casei CIP 102111 TaxID=1255625 RepID=A0A2H1HJS0_9MICO|nr:MFS transporter [Brevibacterium casei]MCT1551345.1 MHS family MFS transporter [Brevibacterium casei]MCT1560663.1 MHS family MFS transporter [Brevibacterium casei]QPR38781.1 MHS family MFS transporter [Brevibacterium casei]QPR42946.1 MHS family MFS transporter [Brevibacterium casei]SMX63154.1 Na+/melibiose symporter [Brevibacterium casei CIP 102111]